MAVHCTLELLEAPLEVAFEELTSATLEVFFAVAWLEALAPVVTLTGSKLSIWSLKTLHHEEHG
jgi:hypothetical protein